MQKAKVQVLKYLKKQRELFDKQSRRAFLNPSTKNVHDLRVTVRRAQAVLWLAKYSSPHFSFHRLSTSLRRLGQVLGCQRQLDVAIQDASDYNLALRELKSNRRKARHEVVEYLKARRRRDISHQIGKAVLEMRRPSELDLEPAFIELDKRIDLWLQKRKLNNEEFHKLRIVAKRARYVIEAVGKPARPLRRLQNRLGRGHDLVVLQDLTGQNTKIQAEAARQYRIGKKMVQPTLKMILKQTTGIENANRALHETSSD